MEAEPAAQVQADYHGPGLDERATGFRKTIDSNVSLSIVRSNSDSSPAEHAGANAEPSPPEKDWLVDANATLIKIIAANNDGKLT